MIVKLLKGKIHCVAPCNFFPTHTMATASDNGDTGDPINPTEHTDGEQLSNFRIKHVKGDLFSCPETDSLVHCVSKDLRMGKGIATLFKKKFEGVPQLKLQAKGVGEVAVLHRSKRYIYYLITKPRYNDKPTYQTLTDSLQAMKKHCVSNNVTAVSMPRIGCGLDKLAWPKVEECLTSVFMDTDIRITVFSI